MLKSCTDIEFITSHITRIAYGSSIYVGRLEHSSSVCHTRYCVEDSSGHTTPTKVFETKRSSRTRYDMAKNSIVPLLILVVVVCLLGAVGFVVYTIVQDISDKTKAKMEKKHIRLSKDGMKVSVKEVRDEDYKDQTQR